MHTNEKRKKIEIVILLLFVLCLCWYKYVSMLNYLFHSECNFILYVCVCTDKLIHIQHVWWIIKLSYCLYYVYCLCIIKMYYIKMNLIKFLFIIFVFLIIFTIHNSIVFIILFFQFFNVLCVYFHKLLTITNELDAYSRILTHIIQTIKMKV